LRPLFPNFSLYSSIIHIIQNNLPNGTKASRGIYLHVYEAIKKAIQSGQLPAHTRMPPTRTLAEKMGLARSTIVKAYSLLTENLLLEAKYGASYHVCAVHFEQEVKPPQASNYPAISSLGESFLHNLELLNSNSEGVAFTPGLPPLDIFPISQWQKLTNVYWRNILSSDLNYSISSGIDSLKKNIANYLLISRKIKCDPKQIVIVSGSLQSLYLIGSVMVDKGNVVCLENPTFPNVISIFKSLQANVLSVDVDNNGLQVSQMDTPIHKAAKLVHTTPSNQYPLGGKMSLTRRLELLEWANTHNAMVIENDYEHEINNWHEPIESLYSLDKQQRTIYLGTFNRILHPSIRLGYMIVPPYLLPSIKALQMHSHRFVPQSIQAVMTEFMEQNLLYKHIRKVIDEAEERHVHFSKLFSKTFGDTLKIQKTDVKSFHVLVQFPHSIQDLSIVKVLEEAGIITHALSKCYVQNPKNQGLILGYSSINKVFMAQYIHKMGGLIKDRF